MSTEIKRLMNTRDMLHKRAMKTNDKLHWNIYRHFRQEVKREIRLAEEEHVRSEILKSNGNTNSIWKILNRYIRRKNTPLLSWARCCLHLNDLFRVPKHCGPLGYVDDTKLFLGFLASELDDVIAAVNEDLKEISIWCCRNSLLINPGKTKLLYVGVLQLMRTLGNLRTTTKFTTTTSVDWEKTGTRTSVSAGKRKLKMQSVGRSTTTTLNVNTNVKL